MRIVGGSSFELLLPSEDDDSSSLMACRAGAVILDLVGTARNAVGASIIVLGAREEQGEEDKKEGIMNAAWSKARDITQQDE
mmetsp:Transcript_5143/g.8451  ORF Transcript_5143/g.8451 Transcript_5143/m.8451 type:complete len:82 (+) Transcript_5143:1237-1482(+)